MNKLIKYLQYCLSYKKFKKYLYMINNHYVFPFYKRHYDINSKYAHTRSRDKILYHIIINYHSIEKGLAKSNIRLGFGYEKVNELLKLCYEYNDIYSDMPEAYIDGLKVLSQYVYVHQKNAYDVDEIASKIHFLVDKIPIIFSEDLLYKKVNKTEFFKKSDLSFYEFAHSRHSIRDFSGEPIDENLIKKVLDLAQTAPSACNRQSVNAYVVYNDLKIKSIVDLQNGGRGFSDKAKPMIVLAYDVQAWIWGEQWYAGYVDGGIYLMNLLYALHHYKIGACPMNWYASVQNDDKLRSLLQIKDSEIVFATVACGVPTDDFKLVCSHRLSSQSKSTFIK